MEKDTTERFRVLCTEFYRGASEHQKAGKALFERLSTLDSQNNDGGTATPGGAVQADNFPAASYVESGFDESFFQLIRSSPEIWYDLNAIKNQARSEAHLFMAQRSLMALKERIRNQQVQCQNNAQQQHPPLPHNGATPPDYDSPFISTKSYLSQFGSDPGLTLAHYSLIIWLRRQQQSSCCVQWTVDIVTLAEREVPFQTALLTVLFALGTLIVDEEEDNKYTWQVKPELSNSFLKRLNRRIKSAVNISPIAAAKIENDVSTHILESVVSRTNIHGEKEDLTTYIVNSIGSLLSDIGVSF